MIRKYLNHKPQTTPWHRNEEPLNHHETPGRQIKQSNQLSLPHQDDCNDLPNDIKNASSVASFKHRLNRNLKPPPRYYNAGSRKGQILQARLRLECSSLNSDLYRKHIVPSPSCQCGEFESAAHFLFNCPIYTNERQTYLPNNLRTFTTKDLLFGCENASE